MHPSIYSFACPKKSIFLLTTIRTSDKCRRVKTPRCATLLRICPNVVQSLYERRNKLCFPPWTRQNANEAPMRKQSRASDHWVVPVLECEQKCIKPRRSLSGRGR